MAWFSPEALNIVAQWRLAYIAPILLTVPFIYCVWHLFLRKGRASKKSSLKKKRSEKPVAKGTKSLKSQAKSTKPQKESCSSSDNEKLNDKRKLDTPVVKDKVNGSFVMVKTQGKKKDIKNKPQETFECGDEIVHDAVKSKVENKSTKIESLNGVKKGITVSAPKKKGRSERRTVERDLAVDPTKNSKVLENAVGPNNTENEEEWQEVRSRKKVRNLS